MLQIMLWAGIALTLLGLVGIVYSILRVIRARRAGLDDDALRAELQAILPWNIGALFVSVLGLMLVIVPVSLG